MAKRDQNTTSLDEQATTKSSPSMLQIEADSVRAKIRRTVGDVIAKADTVRRSAINLDAAAAELGGNSEAEEVRQAAVAIRASAFSMLVAAAVLASKAELLEIFAELRELGDAVV